MWYDLSEMKHKFKLRYLLYKCNSIYRNYKYVLVHQNSVREVSIKC